MPSVTRPVGRDIRKTICTTRHLNILSLRSEASVRRGGLTKPAGALPRVFLSLYGEQLVPPAVTTTPDGGIQLEWFRRGTGVEILFDADGEIFVLVDREGVVESELAGGLRDPFLLQTLPLIRHD